MYIRPCASSLWIRPIRPPERAGANRPKYRTHMFRYEFGCIDI